MNKCTKFTFTEAEKGVSTSYLTMLKWLFKGFSMEETESLKSQMNSYLNDCIIDEYDNQSAMFRADEADWLELLGVLADKFDDLMFDVVRNSDVELSMPLNEDK